VNDPIYARIGRIRPLGHHGSLFDFTLYQEANFLAGKEFDIEEVLP
jgi:hypothetical protein